MLLNLFLPTTSFSTDSCGQNLLYNIHQTEWFPKYVTRKTDNSKISVAYDWLMSLMFHHIYGYISDRQKPGARNQSPSLFERPSFAHHQAFDKSLRHHLYMSVLKQPTWDLNLGHADHETHSMHVATKCGLQLHHNYIILVWRPNIWNWKNLASIYRCNRLKCPRLDCPPAYILPTRVLITPYRFILWPLWPMLKYWEDGQSSLGHLNLLHRYKT